MNFSELMAPGSAGENLILVVVVLATLANLVIVYKLMLVKDPLGNSDEDAERQAGAAQGRNGGAAPSEPKGPARKKPWRYA